MKSHFVSVDMIPRYASDLDSVSITCICIFTVCSAKFVVILGKEFRPGAIVCLRPPSNESYPLFGEIIRVFVPNHEKTFLVRMYNTVQYSSHYNAYEITQCSQFRVVCLKQLAIHDVFHKYHLKTCSYIIIKSFHHVEFDL